MTLRQSRRERAECPNRDQHADGPPGYVQWFEWAETMAKTHNQERCPGCGLYAIWKPKAKASQRHA